MWTRDLVCMRAFAERSRSATAAGEPSPDSTGEQRIPPSFRKRKGRRLLAEASLLGRCHDVLTFRVTRTSL